MQRRESYRGRSDLTKRQSRFYCSAMVLVTFEPHHVLVQFAEKASYNNPLLGFD
jgi:hypothetical protein